MNAKGPIAAVLALGVLLSMGFWLYTRNKAAKDAAKLEKPALTSPPRDAAAVPAPDAATRPTSP